MIKTDPGMLSGLIRGDASWNDRFVFTFRPLICSYLRKRRIAPEDAEDIAQDVTVAVLDALSSFDRTRSFTKWIMGIACRRSNEYLRQLARREKGRITGPAADALLSEGVTDSSPDVDEEFARDLYQQMVRSVKPRCVGQTWDAFWRVDIDRRRPADVATELGMTVRAVYNACHRVRGLLRAEWDGLLS